MLLGNTGDDALMRILRCKAISKGWRLNGYAMGPTAGPGMSHSCDLSEKYS